jgi:hypothetical protein
MSAARLSAPRIHVGFEVVERLERNIFRIDLHILKRAAHGHHVRTADEMAAHLRSAGLKVDRPEGGFPFREGP